MPFSIPLHTHTVAGIKRSGIILPCPLPSPVTCCFELMLKTHAQITKTAVPVDGADTGNAVVVAHSLGEQPVPDLPGKHGGVLAFVIGDLVNDFGSSNLWFGSPDYPGADTARFIVPANQSTQAWVMRGNTRQEVLNKS